MSNPEDINPPVAPETPHDDKPTDEPEERILRAYHRKHQNRLHQFLHKEMEGIDSCPICSINLKTQYEELQQLDRNEKIRPQWNVEAKRILIQALDGECVYCGETREEVLEIDHMVPVAWGGKNDIGNLRLLCSNCHLKRHKGSSKDKVVINDLEMQNQKPSIPLDAPGVTIVECSNEFCGIFLALQEKYINRRLKGVSMLCQNGKVVAIKDPVTGEEIRSMNDDLKHYLAIVEAYGQ